MSYREVYFDQLQELLNRIREDSRELYVSCAAEAVERLARGGMLYTFGTGHAGLLAFEVFYRAGGLARVCPIVDEKLMLHESASASTEYERRTGAAAALLDQYSVGENDVLFVISNSGRNALPVELAIEGRARGAYVAALTSLKHSRNCTARNDSGKRLFEVADIVFDNHGVSGDAAVPTADGGRICPTSTVAGAAILQGLVAEMVETAERRGIALETFCSSNLDGGDERNAALIEKYRKAIPHL